MSKERFMRLLVTLLFLLFLPCTFSVHASKIEDFVNDFNPKISYENMIGGDRGGLGAKGIDTEDYFRNYINNGTSFPLDYLTFVFNFFEAFFYNYILRNPAQALDFYKSWATYIISKALKDGEANFSLDTRLENGAFVEFRTFMVNSDDPNILWAQRVLKDYLSQEKVAIISDKLVPMKSALSALRLSERRNALISYLRLYKDVSTKRYKIQSAILVGLAVILNLGNIGMGLELLYNWWISSGKVLTLPDNTNSKEFEHIGFACRFDKAKLKGWYMIFDDSILKDYFKGRSLTYFNYKKEEPYATMSKKDERAFSPLIQKKCQELEDYLNLAIYENGEIIDDSCQQSEICMTPFYHYGYFEAPLNESIQTCLSNIVSFSGNEDDTQIDTQHCPVFKIQALSE